MSVKKLAEAFQHCPQCGEATAAAGSNPLNCQKCGFTYYFSPITAVGAIVTDSDGRVLFIRRAKDPGKDKLGLPGGFVDAGESLEESLAREVLEESGLKATSMSYITSAPNRYVYKGVEIDVTDMFFHCEVETFDTLEAQEGEVTGFHQVVPTESDLDEMAFESNRIALKMFLENRQ